MFPAIKITFIFVLSTAVACAREANNENENQDGNKCVCFLSPDEKISVEKSINLPGSCEMISCGREKIGGSSKYDQMFF